MTEQLTPPGLSVWERDLLLHLGKHLEEEGALLGEYQTLVADSGSEWVSYLAELIFEEEGRHHRLFSELMTTLRGLVERTEGDQVPPVLPVENRAAVLAVAEKLLERERADRRELKRLAHEIRDLEGVSLWPLLVEMMQQDTDKHEAMLRFVCRRLR